MNESVQQKFAAYGGFISYMIRALWGSVAEPKDNKMKINTNQKCFYAILGLPSSGTSIVSRFFHSLENAFCVVEPFHKDGLGAKNVLDFDKVGPLQMHGPPAAFLGRLHQELRSGHYQMGGIKEVSLFPYK